jgi:hypothetical protein
MGGLLFQPVPRAFAPFEQEPRLTFQRVRRTDARIEEALSGMMPILCERPQRLGLLFQESASHTTDRAGRNERMVPDLPRADPAAGAEVRRGAREGSPSVPAPGARR